GQVEPGAAGVPLAAGPAPQLVVDAPGLVALRADDVEPAQGHHPLPLLGGAGLTLFPQAPVFRPGGQDFLVVGGGSLSGHGDDGRVVAPAPHFLPGHEVGVAAQDDVGAAARHVGGDGHGPFAARLGYDFGFPV